MTKYIIGEIFSSGGETLYKNPSDQTVTYPPPANFAAADGVKFHAFDFLQKMLMHAAGSVGHSNKFDGFFSSFST